MDRMKKLTFLAVVNPKEQRNPVTGAKETINQSFRIEAYDSSEALKLERKQINEMGIKERKFKGVQLISNP